MTQVSSTPAPEPAGAPPATPPLPLYRRPLFWSLVLLLLILLLAGLIARLQWRDAQARDAELARLADGQRARNEQLDAEKERLKKALEDDPCKALEHLRASPSLPGLPPVSAPAAPAAPLHDESAPQPSQPNENLPAAPVAPPSPSPDAGTPNAPPTPDTQPAPAPAPGLRTGTENSPPGPPPPAQEVKTVADLLEQATVLVLAGSSKGAGMGSGFFIAPDTIFTNAHVVMDKSAKIAVVNKATGRLLPGRVTAFAQKNGRDYAVVRLGAQAAVHPLALRNDVRRTDRISAWGFPGAVSGNDPKLKALLKGDLTAAPEVVFTEGSVSVVLERKPPIIVHSAVVSQGNSGGPLVDERGAVVGINTFISLDNKSYRQSSLAITAADMIAFLKENKIPFTEAVPASKGAPATPEAKSSTPENSAQPSARRAISAPLRAKE